MKSTARSTQCRRQLIGTDDSLMLISHLVLQEIVGTILGRCEANVLVPPVKRTLYDKWSVRTHIHASMGN